MERKQSNQAGQAGDGASDDPERRPPAGVQSRGDMTDRTDARGGEDTGDDDTDDGLSPTDEAVRIAAEDTASGDGREDRPSELPVFEAPLTGPKV